MYLKISSLSLILLYTFTGSFLFAGKKSKIIPFPNGITVCEKNHLITIQCTVNLPSKSIELLLCSNMGKTYESFLITSSTPSELHTALILAGFSPLSEVPLSDRDIFTILDKENDKLNQLSLFLSWKDSLGKHEMPIENFFLNYKSSGVTSTPGWFFSGVKEGKNGVIFNSPAITYIATYHDPCAVIELNDKAFLFRDVIFINQRVSPKHGTPVNLIIKPYKKIKK